MATGTSGQTSGAAASTAQDPNASNQPRRSGRLPGTASELPLMMLLACAAFVGASAVRVYRATQA